MDSKPCLTLITSHYPCSTSGDFFEDTIPCLNDSFNIRIISLDTVNDQTRGLPKNVVFTRMPEPSVIGSLFSRIPELFTEFFWSQVKVCKKQDCLSAKTFLHLLSVCSKSRYLAQHLKSLEEYKSSAPLVYYSFLSNEYIFAPLLAKRSAKKNVKSVYRCRGIDIARFEKDELLKSVMLTVDDQCDSICFDCDDRRKYFMKKYANKPTYPYKYSTIRFGTRDHGNIIPEAEPDGALHILSRDPQTDDSGLFLLVNALSLVLDGKIVWHHIGENPKLKMLAESELSANEHVSFYFPGELSYKKRLEYYSEHPIDCFVYLCSLRSPAFEIIEAMSCKIFPAVYNIGGVNEIVDDENGILFPEDITAEELSKALSLMARLDRNAVDKKRGLSRKAFLEHCTAEQSCASLASMLFEVLTD